MASGMRIARHAGQKTRAKIKHSGVSMPSAVPRHVRATASAARTIGGIAGTAAQMARTASRAIVFARRPRRLRAATRRATSGCPPCRSRIAERDARGTPACSTDSRPAPGPDPRPCGSRRPRLHRERQAGARRRAVDLHGAGAAHAMLAADMRAGRAQHMAQEIAEQQARLGLGGDRAPVQRQRTRWRWPAFRRGIAPPPRSRARPRRRTRSRR